MTASIRVRGVLPLAVLLVLAGCKQKVQEGANAQPTGSVREVPIRKLEMEPGPAGPSKADIRAGIEKQLPILQRHDAAMDLRNIALLYVQQAAPPKQIEDLKGLDAETRKALNAGIYVVLWDAPPNTPATAVLAYERGVPRKGGMVANYTASVVRMTPQEFRAAPKAVEIKKAPKDSED